MKIKKLQRQITYYTQYFPFTINTFLCVLFTILAYKLLYKPVPKGEAPSAIIPFIILLGKLCLWVFCGLVATSIVSTIACWIHYIYLKRKSGTLLQISFETEVKNGNAKIYLNAILNKGFRPILGFVKGSIYYDDWQLTDRFTLLSNKRKENSLKRIGIAGRSKMQLDDIKEYQIKGGFLFFQDMLNVFSIAVKQPLQGDFFQAPSISNSTEKDVSPKKTETLDIRIEQLRRVDGEFLNYKNFEPGDDIRRIIWQVYAKNRELVIRIPELFEPYASHLYFYASFQSNYANTIGNNYTVEMLNYFKNKVWTVYSILNEKEWKLKYISEQNNGANLEQQEQIIKEISNSNWQNYKDLTTYFNTKKGSVLCISSLVDIDNLQQLLDNTDASTVVYFIKVSNTFSHLLPLSLISRLIIAPPKDRLSKLKSKWYFSMFRIKIRKQEKRIEEILSKSNVNYAVV